MATVVGDDNESSEACTKENMTKKMTKRCFKSHHDLKMNLVNFNKMMDNASQLYRYFLRWPVATK